MCIASHVPDDRRPFIKPDDDLCWWPATRVAQAIAARELSAREYLDALLTQVERYNPSINAVVTIDENARAAAAMADEAVARGDALGPLHGVAMTVKDSLATAGLRTTSGAAELASYVPTDDAVAVRALRRAGAIVFGKTNLAEYAADVQCHNDLFGTTCNPWNDDFTPGGSSGGSAAAVAAGFSPVELGSDIAGSVRIPAANCGIYGHKPSYGVVSTQGHVPPYPRRRAIVDLAVLGPLARSAGDLELLMSVVAGPGPADALAWRLELPPPRSGRRLAVWYSDPSCPVQDAVIAAMTGAVAAVKAAGYAVTQDRPDIDFSASSEVFSRLLAGIAGGTYSPEDIAKIAAGLRPAGPELGAQFVAQRYVDWKAAHEAREEIRSVWAEFFTRYDAIFLPVSVVGAIRHDRGPLADRRIVVNHAARPYWDQIWWAGLASVALLPATVIPIGTDASGLPIGMSITGPYLEDRTTMRLATELAAILPPPGPALRGAALRMAESFRRHRGDLWRYGKF